MSIIVPVYNVEKYFPETIQSVLCQHFEHYEAIFVNDASTDSCPSLLNKTQQEHPHKIKVIHLKENRGLLYARKIGVQHATGKLISFLDGDDTFLPHAFETMACEMQKRNCDVLMFQGTRNAQILEQDPSKQKNVDFWQSKKVEKLPSEAAIGNEAILKALFLKSQNILWGMMAKVYKTSLLQTAYANTSDSHIFIGEDAYTIFIISYFANRLEFCEKKIYCYRMGSGVSYGNQTTPERLFSALCSAKNIADSLMQFKQKYPLSHNFQKTADWLIYAFVTWRAQNVFDLWRNACNEVFEKDPHHPLYLYCQNLLFVAPLPQSKAEKLGRFLLFPFIQLRHWWRHFLKKFKN